MDIKLLEAFRAVVDNRSVTRAATVLGLTQPAVSAQIARLEALVGFSLFERSGGRLKPTEESRRFYSEVINAIGMIDRLEQIAENIRSGRDGDIVIASHPSASISILPELVSRFVAAHPRAVVKMINRTSEEVRSVFSAASVDIGIAELPIGLANIDLRRYLVDCVAILPTGHPAAVHDVITPQILSGVPFISMAPGRIIGHRIQNTFEELDADFRVVAQAEYFSSICGMVANGLGVSVVDRWSARSFKVHGLEVRPFMPSIAYEIGVFVSADRPPSPLASSFLKVLDQFLKMQTDLGSQ